MAILYADTVTHSMRRAIEETDRRRTIQLEYNKENQITPESIIKPVATALLAVSEADYAEPPELRLPDGEDMDDPDKIVERIIEIEEAMREAARRFEFERAAELRDRAKALKMRQLEVRTRIRGRAV